MRTLKRCVAVLLALVFMLLSCSCAYRSARSSKEERETVLILNDKYEVPYEHYRFAFLSYFYNNYSFQYLDTWSDNTRSTYFKDCDRAAKEEICRIYALFELCEQYGIDPYSRKVDKEVTAAVKDAFYNEQNGYGDRETYLDALYSANMTDSVFRLYLRYNVCEKLLANAMEEAGFVPTDKETVLAYYNSDQTVRATWIYLRYDLFKSMTDDDLNALVNRAKGASDEEFLNLTHQYFQTIYTDAELETGFYFGKYQLDSVFDDLVEKAFSLAEGKTSSIVHAGDGVYIIRRLAKDSSYLGNAENYDYLYECYMLNAFYRTLAETQTSLLGSITETELHDSLHLLNVRMTGR